MRSKMLRCTVVGGCYTDARGIRRKSAVVAERGRLLGVSDLVNRIDGSAFGAGAGVKVYETAAGRLGVVVGKISTFPRSWKRSHFRARTPFCASLRSFPRAGAHPHPRARLLLRPSRRLVRLRIRRRRRPRGQAFLRLSRARRPCDAAQRAGVPPHRDAPPPHAPQKREF